MLVLLEKRSPCGDAGLRRACGSQEMAAFWAFALVAAVALLIVNLTVVGPTVFGISTPLLLGITGIIMMRGERSSSGAQDN